MAYVDMTLKMMEQFGVRAISDKIKGSLYNSGRIGIPGFVL